MACTSLTHDPSDQLALPKTPVEQVFTHQAIGGIENIDPFRHPDIGREGLFD